MKAWSTQNWITPWLAGGLILAGAGAASARLQANNTTTNAANAPTPPAAVAPAVPLPPAAQEVLKLVEAKVDGAVIQAYIRNSQVPFSLNASQIIALKDRGVATDHLAAMLQRSAELRGQAPTARKAAPAANAAQPIPFMAGPLDSGYGDDAAPAGYPSYYYPYYDDYYGYPNNSYWWYDYGYPGWGVSVGWPWWGRYGDRFPRRFSPGRPLGVGRFGVSRGTFAPGFGRGVGHPGGRSFGFSGSVRAGGFGGHAGGGRR